MKINKLFTLLALTALIVSCGTPRYVPTPKNVGNELYGSFIVLKILDRESSIQGELIAVNEDDLVILNARGMITTLPKSSVGEFEVKYANSQGKYGWHILIYTLLSLGHGLKLVISVPVNLITTTSISLSAAKDYKYNNETIGYEKLRMFARFPQGIPEGIQLTDIARVPFLE